jgi:hypothetical protein
VLAAETVPVLAKSFGKVVRLTNVVTAIPAKQYVHIIASWGCWWRFDIGEIGHGRVVTKISEG